MAFTEKISLIVDVVTGNAQSSLSKLKGDVAAAEGGFGKLKAGASGAFSAIAASPAAIAGAAVAVGAFAAKSINAFQETALAAGKFSDATGLSVDASSRLIEVADSIGVSGSAVEGALNKMNKAAATTPKAFADAGIEIAKTASGATDVQQTFLNAVDALNRIEDPAKRAAAASKIFGKGWTEMAELIGLGSENIVDSMAAVSEQQAINDDERAKADAYRAAMDRLGDAAHGLTLELGQSLAPAVADVAANMAAVIETANRLTSSVGGIGGILTKVIENAPLTGGLQNLGDAFDGSASAADRFGGAVGFAVPVLGNFIQSLDGGNKKAAITRDVFGEAMSAVEDFIPPLNSATDMNTRFGGSADAAAQNIGDEAGALRDANDALAEHTNALLAAFDSTFAVGDATRDFAETLLASEQAAQDTKKSAGEVQAAYDEQTQAAVKVAEATVRFAEDQAKANGVTLTAAQSQKTLIDALSAMAAQATGPSKQALLGLIASLQETGRQNPKPTVSLNDQASPAIANARATLMQFGGMSATAVARVTADTSSADRALQSFLSRVRNSSGMVVIGGLTRASGGPIPGNRNEQVPVIAHGGEYVLDAGTVDAIKKGGPSQGKAIGSGVSMGGMGGFSGGNVTINLPVGSDPTAVRRAIDRYALRNGSR